jgi:hypothetical protein
MPFHGDPVVIVGVVIVGDYDLYYKFYRTLLVRT